MFPTREPKTPLLQAAVHTYVPKCIYCIHIPISLKSTLTIKFWPSSNLHRSIGTQVSTYMCSEDIKTHLPEQRGILLSKYLYKCFKYILTHISTPEDQFRVECQLNWNLIELIYVHTYTCTYYQMLGFYNVYMHVTGDRWCIFSVGGLVSSVANYKGY
jgi:hypothetical protein